MEDQQIYQLGVDLGRFLYRISKETFNSRQISAQCRDYCSTFSVPFDYSDREKYAHFCQGVGYGYSFEENS